MTEAKDATARLRKTFRYPADGDDSDSQPEAIDEQEQESLIQRLAAENASRNATFRLLLLPLPLLTTLPYLLHNPLSSRSLLALTSLISTAYLLYIQPPDETGIPFLDALARPATSSSSANSGLGKGKGKGKAVQRPTGIVPPWLSLSPPLALDEKGPLGRYLPYLNAGLCAVILLAGRLERDEEARAYGWIGLGAFPAIVYVAVLVAKIVMAGVDPQGELGALRYEYKGA